MNTFRTASASAKSIWVFCISMLISGAGFVFAPNIFMHLLGFPEVQDVWPRALGMMTILLGAYYGVMAHQESTPFFRATAFGRMTVIVFFASFVAAGFAPPTMIALGVIDLAGGIWTLVALRRDSTRRGIGAPTISSDRGGGQAPGGDRGARSRNDGSCVGDGGSVRR